MKKFFVNTAIMAFVASLLLPSLPLGELFTSAAVNVIVQSGNFSDPSAQWEVTGAYERDFGDQSYIDSVFFDASGVETTDGLKKTDSALFCTQAADASIVCTEFSLRLEQGTIEVVFGAADKSFAAVEEATVLVIGTESMSFGGETVEYGFDISGTRAGIAVQSGENASVTVTCGEKEAHTAIELSSETVSGKYFGFVFSLEGEGAKGNLLDVSFVNEEGQTVAGDSFTDEATVADFGGDEEGYFWKPVVAADVGAGARVLRVVTGNELFIYNSGWPSEFAYTGYSLTGGIGSEYVISYELTLLRSGWLGFIFNSNTSVSAGEYRINDNTVLSGPRTFGAFTDGKVDVLPFGGTGDGSQIITPAASYTYGRKMRVQMHMKQTGDAQTELTISFVYANDPDAVVHSADFVIMQPIGGYVAFTHSAEFIFSRLQISDGQGNLLGGDDFSENGVYGKLTENWYIGLKAESANTAKTENFGEYTDGGISFSEKTGAGETTTLTSRKVVPAREGSDTRENMFSAELSVRAGTLENDGRYSFRFGNGSNEISVYGDRITDGKGTQYPFAGQRKEAYTLYFTAKATGILEVSDGVSDPFVFDFKDENAFAGEYGLSAVRPVSGKMDVAFLGFSLELTGIPSAPSIEVRKPAWVAVGEEVDLTPVSMEDELDDVADLTLTISIEKETGGSVETSGYKAVFPEVGYYTVHYILTNTHGLSAEEEFVVRAIYRGTAENLTDVAYTDFSGDNAGWEVVGSADATGALALAPDGKLATQSDFVYFIAEFNVKGGFEIVFGECHDYENAFGITVTADNAVTLRNLLSETGERTAVLSRDLRLEEEYADIRLKVMGNTVTLYGRSAGDPLVWYELASFSFESDMPATYGTVSLRAADGEASVRKAAVYSLDASIEILPDDYDPADEGTGKHKKPLQGGEGIDTGIIVAIAAAVVVLAAVAAVLIIKKKKGRKQASEGENKPEDGGMGE